MARQLRYSVAASLDGYIAGPGGEFDWIVIDPEIDFEAMYAGFSGVPLLPLPGPRLPLHLRTHRVYATTGTLMLEYDVKRG